MFPIPYLSNSFFSTRLLLFPFSHSTGDNSQQLRTYQYIGPVYRQKQKQGGVGREVGDEGRDRTGDRGDRNQVEHK